MIKQIGHQVDTCKTMDELEAKLPEIVAYDMVLTDMEMGLNSGLDTLESIRKVNADLPVVLMTARSEINEEQVKMMGFSSCLPKPVSFDVLSVLLGKIDLPQRQSATSGISEDTFPTLNELFGYDEEAICEILEMFMQNSKVDVCELECAIRKNDFDVAQHKCHKMSSMFMQIDPGNKAIPLLKKMDASRSDEQKRYEGWMDDVKTIISSTENLMNRIEQYLES